MRRPLRYLILLSILLFVAVNEALIKFRSTSWENPLWVRIYAVSGDGRAATDAYIDSLTTAHFKPIEKFVNREARRHGITIDAIDVEYQGRLDSHPPQPPSGQSVLENMWWSLSFRVWAWKRAWSSSADEGDVELFVSYHDTATTHALRHSVGLQGGMIGISWERRISTAPRGHRCIPAVTPSLIATPCIRRKRRRSWVAAFHCPSINRECPSRWRRSS
jgi:hypothetical protein